MGISPADRRHLFEPFFTCYDTLHHSSGQFQFGKRGIGLGLHMVKTFVEMHGGSVEEVKSSPNEGTTFSILLPRRQRIVPPAALKTSETTSIVRASAPPCPIDQAIGSTPSGGVCSLM